jgi:hypothetical protein
MNLDLQFLDLVVAYLALVLGVGLLLCLIDFAQRKYRVTLKNLAILWAVYTVDWGLRILVYILAIPLILLLFLLQPVMGLAFLIAVVLFIIYGIGLFFEEPIVPNPPDTTEALWALVIIVACPLIWLSATRIFKSENKLYDRFSTFYVDRILLPLQQEMEQFLQKMDE